MKVKLFMIVILCGLFFAANVSAQTVDINKLPEYIVISAKEGSILSDFDADIKIKNSKYAAELNKLEKRLDNDNFVETYTDLFNEMYEIGYEFLESFQKNESGSEHNLVFRKRK